MKNINNKIQNKFIDDMKMQEESSINDAKNYNVDNNDPL